MRKYALFGAVLAAFAFGLGLMLGLVLRRVAPLIAPGNARADQTDTYDPVNHVELDNYNDKLALDDDPSTIIWCTAFPDNASAPFITVPIAGKLTSSSTTALNPEKVINGPGNGAESVVPNVSVDGLYHPNPPQYRFGFTPGHQYVDFFNMPTFCTTKPLQFQRSSIQLDIDGELNQATSEAQQALQDGDGDQAQQILEDAAGD